MDGKFPKWPAWYYGPDGASQIFEKPDDVPDGWSDNPETVGEVDATDNSAVDVAGKLDADNWPWDPSLHAATKSQTKAGLWRMLPGVSRPAPKPAPAPLDL